MVVSTKERQQNNLMKISVIEVRLATRLIDLGFFTIRHLCNASDEELLAVQGINQEKLQAIRTYCAGG